ncbi:MAG: hypothetical protein IKQ37_10240, partial [Bacteroidaceae bacterium]|nr:hypothetical protein [Bacteroidaceae bacterium]
TSHVSYSFFNFGCKTTIYFGIHRYAKCSSLRNKKLALKGWCKVRHSATICVVNKGRLTRLRTHLLGYDLAT